MQINDVTWMIGGEAGYGIQSAGHMLALASTRAGLNTFATFEYPSLIRGGHNSDTVRILDREVGIHKERLDMLLAMNKETLDLHLHEMVAGGGVIYDGDVIKPEMVKIPEGVKAFPVPLKKIAMELGKGDITRNTVGIAATFGLLNFDMEILYQILKEMFGRKGEQIVTNNLAAAKGGYDFVIANYAGQSGYELRAKKDAPRRMLLTGNDALCLGALKAGCKFVAEYPMTPSSGILHFMAKHAKDYNIIVKHTEDEIAAMNMVVGAAWAGVRALTGTSGGGFSLMVEAIGMAGMLEVPVVCVNAQRPGPSTGLPTRTEQCDLQFALHASQGEFPRIVMAPGDFVESFYHGFDAFNIAERYQTPVIVMTDKHLGESIKAVEPFNMEGMKVDRGKLLTQTELEALVESSKKVLAELEAKNPAMTPAEKHALRGWGKPAAEGNYLSPDENFLRYKFTEDGISPRVIPGMKGGIHRAATDEHDETGDLTETPENRQMMVDKRERKMELALRELPAPFLMGADGKKWQGEAADLTFVTWGSPKEAILEVIEMLKADGVNANLLQIVFMSPFHSKEIGEILRAAKHTIGVEMNHDGQLMNLISEKTGYFVHDKMLKYNGRQFTAHEIYDRTKEILKSKK